MTKFFFIKDYSYCVFKLNNYHFQFGFLWTCSCNDVLTPVAFFKSAFVVKLDKSTLIMSLLKVPYTMSFLSI